MGRDRSVNLHPEAPSSSSSSTGVSSSAPPTGEDAARAGLAALETARAGVIAARAAVEQATRDARAGVQGTAEAAADAPDVENAVVDTLRAAAEAVARAEAEGATMAAAAAARAERASLAAAEQQPGGKSVRSLDVRPGSVFTVAGLSKAELQLVATAEESAAKLPPSLAAYGDELWSFPNTEGGGSAHASVEVADIVASITPPPDVHIDAAVTMDAAATTSYGCNILRNYFQSILNYQVLQVFSSSTDTGM